MTPAEIVDELETLDEKVMVIAEDAEAILSKLVAVRADIASLQNRITPPPPPPTVYTLVVGAVDMTLTGQTRGFRLDGDHIVSWGNPGQEVSFRVRAEKPGSVDLEFDYVLARDSSVSSARAIRVEPITAVIYQDVVFEPTCEIWEQAVHDTRTTRVAVPAGECVIRIAHAGQEWSNWLDPYTITVTSPMRLEFVSTLPPVITPPPPPPPPPPLRPATWSVPQDGTLQQVVDRARPGDDIEIDGDYDATSQEQALRLVDRDNGDGVIVIRGKPGTNAQIRCWQGILGFGANVGWTFEDFAILPNGSNQYSSGIYFHGGRTDYGATPIGCARITYMDIAIGPLEGSGRVQRDGLAIWGGDLLTVQNCRVTQVATNVENGDTNTRGSGISIGQTIRHLRLPARSDDTRVWIVGNDISDIAGAYSIDGNGINLDMYKIRDDHMIGRTVIESNRVWDVDGRGILCAWTGEVDLYRNWVGGAWCRNMINGFRGAIVGYGGWRFDDLNLVDNTVEPYNGYDAYQFNNYDAPTNSIGIRGSGNRGGPVNFVASGPIPDGFTAT